RLVPPAHSNSYGYAVPVNPPRRPAAAARTTRPRPRSAGLASRRPRGEPRRATQPPEGPVPAATHPASPAAPAFEMQASRHLVGFVRARGASLAVTTYQAGKLLLIGTGPEGRLSLFERSLPRCMGLSVTPEALHVATQSQLWHFQDVMAGAPAAAGRYAGHD